VSVSSSFLGAPVDSGLVLPEWIDYNGHMNVAYYVLAFDLGVDALWRDFGITEEHVAANQSSTFAVETHVLYKQELKLDDPYVVTSQILAFDEKRIHQLQRMYHSQDGFLAATAEWMSLHVDLDKRRVAPWPVDILAGISRVAAAQPGWEVPAEQGNTMVIKNPIWTAAQILQETGQR
jgi:acyl-CoA thioester hydrolase